MSFILDALRKAERTNQSQRDMAMPSRPRILMDEPPAPPTDWRKIVLVILAGCALLAIGLILGSWGNDKPAESISTPTHTSSTSAARAQTVASGTAPRTAPLVATLRDTGARSLDAEISKTTVQNPPAMPATQPSTSTRSARNTERKVATSGQVTVIPGRVDIETIPDYHAALASAEVPLPKLHLDMHVYSSAPEKRVVFVNLDKYRQGDSIDDDTRIESIEPNGAIINYKGFRFILRAD